MKSHSQKHPFEGARKFLAKICYNWNTGDISNKELQRVLDRFLSSPELNQRDIEILTQRYALFNNDNSTYKEIGLRFGLTGERVRQLEAQAIKKIVYPEGISEKRKTRIRLRKLIPSLEYDVLYDPLHLARKLRVSDRLMKRSINKLCEEFDLALIEPYSKSKKSFIMRIGEQSQDLPVPSDPSEVPESDTRHYSQEGYEIEYRRFWKEMESGILSRGYISSSLTNESFYQGYVRKRVFRDFMRDSMLPIAVYQDYRIGQREPLVIYHPGILRNVINKSINFSQNHLLFF